MTSRLNKDETTTQPPQASQLCSAGCGFFGNSDKDGMCSLCYKTAYPSAAAPVVEFRTVPSAEVVPEPLVETKVAQKKRNRCWECKKKLKLVQQFECKCSYVYCQEHRYADGHSCEFNYKAEHAKNIERANPVVQGDKIVHI